MNLTPQSMRSPCSPFDQQSKNSFSSQRPYYPATPQPESSSMEQTENQGLGLFNCPMPQNQSTIHNMPPSPQPSDGWSHSSMMEQDYPQSTQPPDIFSAAFDPFSGYSAASNTGMMAGSSPEAPGLVFCQTPPNTDPPSHRSSISSPYSPSEGFSPNHSEFAYTPKVKVEESGGWYHAAGSDQVLQRALTTPLITQDLSPYPGVSPISAPIENLYKAQADQWPKPNAPSQSMMLHNTQDVRSTRFDSAPILPSVTRIKKKRQRTTPEEATHKCRVCGKLFKRSYNWKSHMETHNPERKYPHPCTAMVGNTPCTKKFQRKTDLDRHYDSV